MKDIIHIYKEVKNYTDIIIKRENGNKSIIRKGNTICWLCRYQSAALVLWEATLQFSCPCDLHKEYAIELQHVMSREVKSVNKAPIY